MNTFQESGFTKIELLVVILILCIFASFAIPGLTSTMVSEREAETKNNLHIIRMAIERYFLDNDKYPPFLLGGDVVGWDNWHQINDDDNPPSDEPSNNLVHDVLIQYGYLQSYPKNPFVGDGMAIIKSTGGVGTGLTGEFQPGDGDPRFGFYGNTMGNGLSDPAFYQHLNSIGISPTETPLIETRRTLSDYAAAKHGFLDPPDGVHYMMGGLKTFDSRDGVKTVANWWPGNFFYRGLVDYQLVRMGWTTENDPGVHPPGAKFDFYMLG
ncbi:type II secretion system GspH family protein, partial [bacterium]|nr:type II secretion system GspH family protein [bacterium]MBU1024929.1 type II secretion system GspH family protein [bacterium]